MVPYRQSVYRTESLAHRVLLAVNYWNIVWNIHNELNLYHWNIRHNSSFFLGWPVFPVSGFTVSLSPGSLRCFFFLPFLESDLDVELACKKKKEYIRHTLSLSTINNTSAMVDFSGLGFQKAHKGLNGGSGLSQPGLYTLISMQFLLTPL